MSINVELGGEHTLGFRYALGKADDPDRPLDISVNGIVVVPSLSFPNTGDWATWQIISIKVLLRAGANTIRASTTGMSGPNMDHVVVTAPKPFIFLTRGGDLTPREEPEFGEAGYENTYYGKVDPTGDRTTLEGWKRVNGLFDFPLSVDNAEYINAFDLGFGRNMFCLDNGRASCYVDNYLDPKGEGDGPLFAAAVTMERMNFLGRTIVAFFVFAPAGGPTPVRPADSELVRTNQIQLDKEGPKSVPESCYACHRGYTSPGGNPVGRQYLPWDLDLLKDWPGRPKRNAQLDAFRRLNRIVWSDASPPYQRQILNPANPSQVLKEETIARKASLVELIEGRYDGPPFIGQSFVADRLPNLTWFDPDIQSGACDVVQTPGGFELADANKCNRFTRQRFLYKNVYATSCRSCHVAEGPTQDVNENFDGLNWNEAAVFYDQAYYLICDSTTSLTMPHAELTFNRFHDDLITTTDGKVATAKDRLCGEPPEGFVPQNRANDTSGEMVFTSKGCTSCHTVEDGGFPKPDLTCKGARVFKDLGKLSPVMSGLMLADEQEVADVRKYLDSFPLCP